MVIPVVVVGNVVYGSITVAVEMNLTCIPEVVVGVSYVLRLLGIKRAVTLCLVGVSACITVEEVTVMHPDMVITLLETDVVTLRAIAVHKSKVADLNVAGILDTDTKAVYGGILAHTLNGETDGVVLVFDQKVALVKRSSAAKILNVTNETNANGYGRGLQHARRENVGDARICCAVNSGGHAILVAVGNVNHNRAVL